MSGSLELKSFILNDRINLFVKTTECVVKISPNPCLSIPGAFSIFHHLKRFKDVQSLNKTEQKFKIKKFHFKKILTTFFVQVQS